MKPAPNEDQAPDALLSQAERERIVAARKQDHEAFMRKPLPPGEAADVRERLPEGAQPSGEDAA